MAIDSREPAAGASPMSNAGGLPPGQGSRHGGHRTWLTGCLTFFRGLVHHPRHSAG